mmetsp:Transcript_106827/g.309965  ORF Transcript_106827/g.309965 Transcript_106827/m.309965 type:complete len:210 (-) Transcript_106827:679-1308(-)
MCYYKLDYYDVSLEILAVYLQAHPDSAIAVNLKACNHFRLYNGRAAEAELKVLSDQGHNLQANDLIRHNMVVFSMGDSALQVLPQLVDFIPEARLNLVIYYLRHEGVQEAFDLIKDLEPSTPQEYILKGMYSSTALLLGPANVVVLPPLPHNSLTLRTRLGRCRQRIGRAGRWFQGAHQNGTAILPGVHVQRRRLQLEPRNLAGPDRQL